MTFKLGAKDGFPISLGYFAVAVAFGVAAVGYGFPAWSPILISLTNYTGSGQALGVQLLAASATTLAELTVAMLIINVRYALMSVTVSQLLSPKVKLWQRFIIAFGVTDENFAVAVSRRRELTFAYLMGVELTAFAGWVGGTVVGALVGNVLPDVVMTAFGIALPAMFIAIVLPPCRASKPAAIVVGLSVAMSCAFYYIPGLDQLSKGWVYVICGIVSALVGAAFFPVRDDEKLEPETGAALLEGDACGNSPDDERKIIKDSVGRTGESGEYVERKNCESNCGAAGEKDTESSKRNLYESDKSGEDTKADERAAGADERGEDQ